MKDFPVALQLYSVRDAMEADFRGTLEKIKAFGYDGVEFAGLFDKTPEEVKAMCDEIGLTPISAHVPYMPMYETPEILDAYKTIGCSYVAIPHLSDPYLPGGHKYEEYVGGVNKISARCKELGMQLCYHNHDFEFQKVGEDYKIDIMYDTFAPEVLQPEFDTCWVKVAGENPVDYIHKYAGREEVLHLKDFVGTKSENMYELIGVDEGEDKKAEDTTAFDFRPVGHGCQDFPAILAAAKEVGVKWVIVEQDNPCLGKTPMECAEMSIQYLNSL